MTASDNLMGRLRLETEQMHHEAEQRPVEKALAAGTLPRETYHAWLAQRYHFHTYLEAALGTACQRDARLARLITPDQFQAANARADLDTFQVDLAAHPPLNCVAAARPTLDQWAATAPPRLLGVHYVLEGSKNGGRYLARSVQRAYGLTGPDGTRYLDPHGAQQRPLWQAFKNAVNAESFSADESDAIVAAAQQAYRWVSAIDDALRQFELAEAQARVSY